MRQIAIGSAEGLEALQQLQQGVRQPGLSPLHSEAKFGVKFEAENEIYRGEDAYRFLLQVICGLHSPLVGETEVYGQFRNAVSAFAVPVNPWGLQARKFFQALFEDAKKIRQQHLKDLGSQSYGSVIRRELRGQPRLSRVHILGAGHLVQEILPWITKDETEDNAEIHVHCRDPKKSAEALKAFPGVRIHDLSEGGHDDHDKDRAAEFGAFGSMDALVIAAPVTAEWVRTWVPASADLRWVVDLRGDSADDPIPMSVATSRRVLTLPELFGRISSNQVHVQSRKRAALAAVDAAVSERSRFVENRPFGWEDVCA